MLFYNENELENFSIGEDKAFYYLHGLYENFALALNEKYGYDIEFMMSYDEEIEHDVLDHAFCKTNIDGKDYFIDIRGITDNIDDILDGFDYFDVLENTFMIMDREQALNFLEDLHININEDNIKPLISYLEENNERYDIKLLK